MEREATPFSEVSRSKAVDFEAPLLSELIGETFVIASVKLEEGEAYGLYAMVKLDDGRIFRTSSAVLVKQVADIGAHFENGGGPVTVTLVETKSQKTGRTYYQFE